MPIVHQFVARSDWKWLGVDNDQTMKLFSHKPTWFSETGRWSRAHRQKPGCVVEVPYAAFYSWASGHTLFRQGARGHWQQQKLKEKA